MRLRPAVCLLALPLAFGAGGCGYVHFGRLPESSSAPVVGDNKLLAENSELKLEKKMLQQELALSRAQGDALRMAIENRSADGDTSRRLAAQLNETMRELTQLRANQARLPAAASGASDEEMGRLRSELAQVREHNLALTREVRVITARHEQAQAALAQLNAELLSQREARSRAEENVTLLSTELRAVAPDSTALARLRTGTASEARTLGAQPSAAREGGAPAAVVVAPTESRRVELASEPQVPRESLVTKSNGGVTATLVARVSAPAQPPTSEQPADKPAGRLHVVAAGDTLAKISARYYGTPSRWREILDANRDVLGEGNNLVVGNSLRIP